MGTIPLVLMIIRIIMQIVGKLPEWNSLTTTEKEIVASAVQYRFVSQIGDGTFLKWLWENKEEVIEFVLKIIGLIGEIGSEDDLVTLSSADWSSAGESLIAALED